MLHNKKVLNKHFKYWLKKESVISALCKTKKIPPTAFINFEVIKC